MKLLADLVALDSATGNERAIADYIAAKLDNMGHAYHRTGNSLIGKIAGSSSGRAFILNGHIDTVPLGEAALWQNDPYKLTIKASKAYGLGVSDMKSGIAVMLNLLNHYTTRTPLCDLWFMFVEGEEIDGAGTKKLLQYFKKFSPQYAEIGGVILEPTGSLAVGIGHKGNAFFEVTAKGLGGHSSQATRASETALSKLAAFINDLPFIQDNWNQQFDDSILGSSTINVTGIKASSAAPNIIPASASAQFDIRFNSALAAELHNEIEKICRKYGLELNPESVTVAWFGICAQESLLFRALQNSLPKLPTKVFQGATDQCFFTEAGIDLIIYGPGDPLQMHQPNESVDFQALGKCELHVKQLIKTFSQM